MAILGVAPSFLPFYRYIMGASWMLYSGFSGAGDCGGRGYCIVQSIREHRCPPKGENPQATESRRSGADAPIHTATFAPRACARAQLERSSGTHWGTVRVNPGSCPLVCAQYAPVPRWSPTRSPLPPAAPTLEEQEKPPPPLRHTKGLIFNIMLISNGIVYILAYIWSKLRSDCGFAAVDHSIPLSPEAMTNPRAGTRRRSF